MGIFSTAGTFFRPGASKDGFNELTVNFSDGICWVLGVLKTHLLPRKGKGKRGESL